MLTLTEAQLQALNEDAIQRFVQAVCKDYLAERPQMHTQFGEAVILARMQKAYDYAMKLNFTSTPHIVRLMWLATDVPFIIDDPMMETYLGKPGATPEQRLDDLDMALQHKLKRRTK
jgi:hypothetical protein